MDLGSVDAIKEQISVYVGQIHNLLDVLDGKQSKKESKGLREVMARVSEALQVDRKRNQAFARANRPMKK